MPARHAPVSLRRVAPVLAALALTCFGAAAALADGDPASDVLLGENVFYPYTPPVTPTLQKTLNKETAAAKASGFPLKVALIASPVDLGVIPDLFGQPQRYAKFLDQEISFRGKQPLLVVMPAGYGVEGLNARATAAVAGIPKPAGKTSNDLAKAAITAVAKLADASGHPITGVAGVPESSSSGGGGSTVLIVALAVAAALVAAALAVITLRRRRARTPPAGAPRA